MRKYKIAVYAISKNEEKFVDRWFDSIKDADEVYVLDTGSTDKTVSKLKKKGALVKVEKITPWRFDVARNKSLEMVADDVDICICLDLDEVMEEGWRDKLEKIWQPETMHMRYNYNWSFDDNGNPAVNFYINKIHQRHDYIWKHPVHETINYIGKDIENLITTDEVTVNHYPDLKKSRSSYLPLLELSVEENPEDDRNMHYLGREYMYYGKWNECIDTLIKHLNLKSATWKDERSASMRFISRSYQALNRFDEARMWLDKAIAETPYLRDPYVERALLEYRFQNWDDVIRFCKEALKIEKHEKSYINEPFSWNYTIYDLLSISYFYLNDISKSLEYSNKALQLDPTNDRLIQNNKIIKKFIK